MIELTVPYMFCIIFCTPKNRGIFTAPRPRTGPCRNTLDDRSIRRTGLSGEGDVMTSLRNLAHHILH